MKRLVLAHGVEARIAELESVGPELYWFDQALEAFARGRALPQYLNDHALRPPLGGYRSCVVGYTADRRTVVAIYTNSPRRVVIHLVDEHDMAYREMRERVGA